TATNGRDLPFTGKFDAGFFPDERPCRACKIKAVHAVGHKTNYTPLSRAFVRHADPPCYDPLDLPLRTHADYLKDAIHVESATTDLAENRRARRTGIKSLSPLVRISSLNFPKSFPHDFMHVMFENIIPMLLDLWTQSGKWKSFGTEHEDYHLPPDVWSAIGKACASSGKTIPSAFGCRVPDVAKSRYELTAESKCLFATHIGPALLRNRFRYPCFYQHFVRLVQLIHTCLDLEITRQHVEEVRRDFSRWVQDFERCVAHPSLFVNSNYILLTSLYVRNDPGRLRLCTLPIHSLLHIADDIEAMGPVWAYWAFPMERFCGFLARSSKSRRYPFSSFNRRVLQCSQLAQIKLIYGLTERLDLEERHNNIAKGTHYAGYPDLVFVKPHKNCEVPPELRRKFAQYISTTFNVSYRNVYESLDTQCFETWGKMQQTEKSEFGEVIGGDLIRGNNFPSGSATRDASHVKYLTRYSRWRVDNRRFAVTELAADIAGYGRAERFVVIDTDFLQRMTQSDGPPRTFDEPAIIAVISPIPELIHRRDCNLVEYRLRAGNYAAAELVCPSRIMSLVGRVHAHNKTAYIVDRGTTVVGQLDMLDATLNADEYI
ncbi:hypothetical protein BDV93DRAFT_84112, partial [Ceratobasidium sp. AG-I]